MLKVGLCLLLVAFFGNKLEAQVTTDTTTLWQIKTNDGNIYVGYIISSDEEQISLKTLSLGTIRIKAELIKRKEVIKDNMIINGEVWTRNRMANRMMLAPTGILQKQDEGFFENKYLFINHLNLPIGDGISLGLGMMPLFVFDEVGTPVWITTKIGIPVGVENLHIAIGAFASTILFDEYNDGNIFIGYTMATYGNENISVTFGLGHGYAEYGWLKKPALAYGGTARVSKRTYLFVEQIFGKRGVIENNYELRGFLSLGARTMWRKVSLDFGVLKPQEGSNDRLLVVPYAGVAFPLNR